MKHEKIKQANITPDNSELGKKSSYDSSYNPELLYAIQRAPKRQEIGINPNNIPFHGFDCWNHYELSWLNPKGKPMVAIGEIIYDCNSPSIVESKSLKLYLNSFNNHKFYSIENVITLIKTDIAKCIEADVAVSIRVLQDCDKLEIHTGFIGECIDYLDIDCDTYTVEPSYLTTTNVTVNEIIYSNLLKSNCLVTGQPDWGSILIKYVGKKINHANLLKYIVSYRNHNEFHEQCIERIFNDIMNHCNPEKLTVYGRYTRRGGLDINPYRSTEKNINSDHINFRLIRQ